ncbi:MAG: DUF4968 domain-containing protein, partial [Pseudolabrys sp.]|nr:DUF4968 domain-containing protein [Pseudolabrys sp.]
MKPVETAAHLQTLPNGIELDCGNGRHCQILLTGPRFARLVFIPADGFRQDRTWMILGSDADVPWQGRPRLSPDATEQQFSIEKNDGAIVLSTQRFSIRIQLDPFRLHWSLPDGRTFAADRPSFAYAFGQHNHALLHAMVRRPQDRYYGLGDKTGPLNLHGRRLRTAMTDALGFDPKSGDPLYKHWPFLIVRDGETGTFYGLLYDNLTAANFDLGAEHSNYFGLYRSYEVADGDLDYTLVFGPTLRDVVASFAELTG